jgi:hypothetical protein
LLAAESEIVRGTSLAEILAHFGSRAWLRDHPQMGPRYRLITRDRAGGPIWVPEAAQGTRLDESAGGMMPQRCERVITGQWVIVGVERAGPFASPIMVRSRSMSGSRPGSLCR